METIKVSSALVAISLKDDAGGRRLRCQSPILISCKRYPMDVLVIRAGQHRFDESGARCIGRGLSNLSVTACMLRRRLDRGNEVYALLG